MASKSTTYSSTQRSSRKHSSSTSRRTLSLLHLTTTIFTFPAIIITIATVALWNANFFHKSGPLRGDWADGLLLIPLTLSFIISLSQTITACLGRRRQRQRKQGIGTHGDYLRTRTTSQTSQIVPILATITILALFIPLLALAGMSGLFRLWRPTSSPLKTNPSNTSPSSALTLTSTSTLSSLLSATTRNHITRRSLTATTSSFKHCTLSEIFTRPCNPTLFTIGSLQLSIIALSSLIWLLELAILIYQIKQHRYTKRKRNQSLRYKARALMAEKSPTNPTHPAYTYKSKSTRSPSPSILGASTQPAPARPSPTKTRERVTLNRTASDSSTSSHSSGTQAPHSTFAPPGVFTTRPKQYHYDPQISRSRSQREACTPVPSTLNQSPRIARPPPTYVEGSGISDADRVAAVEEVRLKLRPSETMGAFLAARYA